MISMEIQSFEIEMVQKVTGALLRSDIFLYIVFQTRLYDAKSGKEGFNHRPESLHVLVCPSLHGNVSSLPLPRLARLALIGRGWTPLIRICEQKFDEPNYYSVPVLCVMYYGPPPKSRWIWFFQTGISIGHNLTYRGVLQSIPWSLKSILTRLRGGTGTGVLALCMMYRTASMMHRQDFWQRLNQDLAKVNYWS